MLTDGKKVINRHNYIRIHPGAQCDLVIMSRVAWFSWFKSADTKMIPVRVVYPNQPRGVGPSPDPVDKARIGRKAGPMALKHQYHVGRQQPLTAVGATGGDGAAAAIE